MKISKSGIISASGSGINENLYDRVYSPSQAPVFDSNAGNTILSWSRYPDFVRYTCTTQGNDGGNYTVPCSSLVDGKVYTWSIELRASSPKVWSRGRIGFEGGGMISGGSIVLGTDWIKLFNTWTQYGSIAFVFYPCGDLDAGAWIDVRNLKLEEGNKMTPYTFSKSDSNVVAYTGGYMGENQGFVEETDRVKIGNDWLVGKEFIEI